MEIPASSAGRDQAALPERLKAEQIDILFRHAPLAQTTNFVVSSVVVWFLWRFVPLGTLLGWWAAVVALVALRLGLVAGYRRRGADTGVAWHTLMTLAAAASGVLWGAAGILFFLPESPAVLIFITIILAGMTAGSISSHSSWLPAQFSYAILTMSPIAVCYLFAGDDLWPLGLMCLIYLANILLFARMLSRTLIESLRLRFDNQELVQQLREQMAVTDLARARAEDANLAKSKFLAAASHDLRQPLHAVNLFVEALRQEPDPASARTLLAHMSTSTQSLEDLLNELLDISKLEAGLFKPQLRTIPVQELFDALEHELWPVAREEGLRLKFMPTKVRVSSDPSMLGRILRNIITNAIRYTGQGSILVGCRRQGRRVAIAVCDTGPGIAPEHHQAIFREFYQLGNPERDRRKGLGLGLAIVDGLCRVLDHPLALQSRVGHGTTFSVAVPVASAEAPMAAMVPERAAYDLSGFSVLVIDDEPAICQAMTDVLGRWGCRILTTESAHDALARLADGHFRPDAIVADYRLREGRTGISAIAQVRQLLGWPVPAAILTGDTAPERLMEASASGFLLLHKPVQPGRLRAALSSLRQEAISATTEDEKDGIVDMRWSLACP